MIFDLAKDFHDTVAAMPREHPKHRMLELLEEAIRRDIHFIARHPTTLFQCMWNTCWWYDCHEAAKHYEEPVGGWTRGKLPWDQPDLKLHELLEQWRETREIMTPGFYWLRSLRPPPLPLNTAQRLILIGHVADVDSLAFSPDGHQIVSGSRDGTIRCWDVASGRECMRWNAKDSICSVAFSPDGRRIASGGDYVRLWDADNGMEVASFRTVERDTATCDDEPHWSRYLRDKADGVNSLTFSPNGKNIIAGSRHGSLLLWSAHNGEQLSFLLGHTEGISSIACSCDGTLIVSGSYDRSVRLWDAATGKERRCIMGHTKTVSCVAISPDKSKALSASEDCSIAVWDTDTGTEIMRIQGHSQPVSCVAFFPDGRRIVSGSFDCTVRLWDTDTGKELVCLRGHEQPIKCVAVSAKGDLVASGDMRGYFGGIPTIRLWDSNIKQFSLRVLDEHDAFITSVACSLYGNRAVSGSWDQTVRIWSTIHGRLQSKLCGHNGQITYVAISADGLFAASCSKDGTVRVWCLDIEREILCLQHNAPVEWVEFRSQNRIWSYCDGNLHVWDTIHGDHLSKLPCPGSPEPLLPKYCRISALETAIEKVGKGKMIAYFPIMPHSIASDSTGRTWVAASYGNHVYILVLESQAPT